MHTVPVSLGERSYEILIGAGIAEDLAPAMTRWASLRPESGHSRSAAMITDRNVEPHARQIEQQLAAAGWNTRLVVLEPGEPSKSLDVIANTYDHLVEMQADRRTTVIAVGGGVIGDAAGFVAATYARGLPFVQVPTSLLADVDSSVGGKVGVNHPRAKNLIGAFHQPLGVLIDTSFLTTLPDREFNSGMAEIVKYGVILDSAFFDWLEANASAINHRDASALQYAIARSCELKAQVVEQDEFERSGLRAVLNYGHTFAHAFEALCGYGTLLHGEAVSIGMICASRLAERLGRITEVETRRQLDLLKKFQLPTTLPDDAALQNDDILQRMRLDKKTVAGELRFVLPLRIGQVELVSGVPEADVVAVLDATKDVA